MSSNGFSEHANGFGEKKIRRELHNKTFNNVMELVGNTPIVKLNKVSKLHFPEGVEVFCKLEYFNPGGSVKDRIALKMIEDAEAAGKLIPGKSIVIEPTSGNTGIGLSFICAIKGYECIIVIPEKMSDEKVDTMRALGAHIIKTPTEVSSLDPRSNIMVARRLAKEKHPYGIILDQYDNMSNPQAHYENTAVEILEAMDHKLDMIVFGTGTGGTASGIARRFQEELPSCLRVGADPYGSILAQPDVKNNCNVQLYQVEGIGYDFVPDVLSRGLIDLWIKTNDKESFAMARALIKDEGILAGGSSGAALWAAAEASRMHPEKKRILVILPDSIRNYMTKFVKDQWMEAHQFKQVPDANQHNSRWWNLPLSESVGREIVSVADDATIKEALESLTQSGLPAITVVDSRKSIVGVISADAACKKLANPSSSADGGYCANEAIMAFVEKQKWHGIDMAAVNHPTLGLISRMLDIAPYIVTYRFHPASQIKSPQRLITSADLLAVITDTA